MLTKKQIESEGFKITFTNGTGAGGQKRNRTYSVAIVEHLDSGTGTIQRCDETRNANKNMNLAYEKIINTLKETENNKLNEYINKLRNDALNKGTIRTYDYKRGLVKDHETGKEADLKKVLNGHINLLKKIK